MVKFRQKGDFSKTLKYLGKLKNPIKNDMLEKYGREGVAALSSATPVDTGLTASSWYYKITKTTTDITISYCNSNLEDGVPIAIILQYGHGTGTGGWVQGRDYINPAIRPIFDKLAENAWKEVIKL